MDYLKTLNKEQLEAVIHQDGPCLVMAGAGSGKTKVLTTRIAHLINNGIWPSNILAITFTNKAAKEMKDRVKQLVGDTSSFIGTFHSFGLKIIRENPEVMGLTKSFSILDTDDTISVIKKILKEKNLDSKKFNPNYIKNKISSFKNELLTDKELKQSLNTNIDKIILDIYYKYEEVLSKSNAIDFDDLLLKPVRAFLNNENLLERYQDHYPYILVDEYQDTNPIQYKLTSLLSQKYKNIFVVGDMNQSIYSFRYADYRNILNFERDFKDAKIIKLEQNYRSTQNILSAANSVIKNNTHKKELSLWSEKKTDEKIRYLRGYDGVHEIKLVIDEINSLKSRFKSYSSFAILYRTNAQSRTIEQTLLSAGIPYKVYGGFSYINRKEIKDLVAYLKLVNNQNDEISLRRIINVPKRGIGEAALHRIETSALSKNESMFNNLETTKELAFKNIILDMINYSKNHTLTELVDYIIDKSQMKSEYELENSLESEIRLDNLNEFKSLTELYEIHTGQNDLGDFLNEISLMSDNDNTQDSNNSVKLMTLHSAKGLEFDVVFLVGMEEGLFPHINSITSGEGLDEERRLCYVGITRARELLYITNAKRRLLYGKEQANLPSRFIDEIDQDLLYETTKSFEPKIIIPSKMYEQNDLEFNMGDIIKHETLGTGVVLRVSGDLIDVAFKTGPKKLNKNHKSISKVTGEKND